MGFDLLSAFRDYVTVFWGMTLYNLLPTDVSEELST
jgi:hypothetical protein